MRHDQIEGFPEKLDAYLEDLLRPMRRVERKHQARLYLDGLLRSEGRKNVARMANKILRTDVQALQQFISQSPWDHRRVRAKLARRIEESLLPKVFWIIDEGRFPKQGEHSVGVTHGPANTQSRAVNHQLAVVLTLATEEASMPLNWALHLPPQWTSNPALRKKAAIPEEVTFKRPLELALDLIDEVKSWGLQERTVLAGEHFGASHDFRIGLKERALGYVVKVTGDLRARINGAAISSTSRKRTGKIRPAHVAATSQPAGVSLHEIAETLPWERWRRITWREAPGQKCSARFARISVSCIDCQSPDRPTLLHLEELLIERPENARHPFRFWLSGLGPETSWQELIRSAKGHARYQQDRSKMLTEWGVDHYQGRSWRGWHHHVTLVTMAQAFLLHEELSRDRSFWVDLIS